MFALIGGLVLPMTMDAYHSYNFKSEQNLVLSLLQKARSQSMSNINQVPHGLHVNQSLHQYTLFQGVDYTHRDTGFDLVYDGSTNYSLSGLSDVIFTQLSGDSNTAGNIILDDRIHPQAKIILNNEGQINW